MRKILSAIAIATALVVVGVACDDAPVNHNKMDEDDGRFGPGDGVDERGPFR